MNKYKTDEGRICRIISKNSSQGSDVWIIEYEHDHSVAVYNRHDLTEIIPEVVREDDGNFRVECAFRKWSIGWDQETMAVEVEFNSYPNIGSISLYDVNKEDFIRLSKMFAQLAEIDVWKEWQDKHAKDLLADEQVGNS